MRTNIVANWDVAGGRSRVRRVAMGRGASRSVWRAPRAVSAGFVGGRQLIIVPEYDLIAIFTDWGIRPSTEGQKHDQLEREFSLQWTSTMVA
jgi:hypothetical protein